ncbi:unnamed protein product [Absidia cylindrospora]
MGQSGSHLEDMVNSSNFSAEEIQRLYKRFMKLDKDNSFIKGLSAFSARGNIREKLEFTFKVYDMDRDGFISNGELFLVLKMMVGNNLKDNQLQQIVDKTIMEADKDMDGKISFDEFLAMVENTDVANKMTLESF